MAEPRRPPPEGTVEFDMFRQRGEPFLCSDHVRYAHEMIVHHIGKMVGRKAVALEQYLVIDTRILKRDLSPEQIPHGALPIPRHREAYHVQLV